jgi:hypothetical protein
MGQSLQWHLGGGASGIKHFMDHLMTPLEGMMQALGTPNITPELKQKVINGVMREAAGRSVDQLAQEGKPSVNRASQATSRNWPQQRERPTNSRSLSNSTKEGELNRSCKTKKETTNEHLDNN